MVVVLRPNTPKEKTEMLIEEIKSQYAGVACHCTEGTQVTIIGLVGDTSHVDMDSICLLYTSSIRQKKYEIKYKNQFVKNDESSLDKQ